VRPYLEKPFTKIGLVEWLKVKALSSSPSTPAPAKKKVIVGGISYVYFISVSTMFISTEPGT
jgi:hypothetical protein